MELREWLFQSEYFLALVFFIPLGLVLLIMAVGSVASHARGQHSMLRRTRWGIPVLLSFVLYYAWVFESSVWQTIWGMLGVVASILAVSFVLDSIQPDSPLVLRLLGRDAGGSGLVRGQEAGDSSASDHADGDNVAGE